MTPASQARRRAVSGPIRAPDGKVPQASPLARVIVTIPLEALESRLERLLRILRDAALLST